MKPADRRAWIEAYLRKFPGDPRYYPVSVVDAHFVTNYIRNCVPERVGYTPYGADRVPQLGRDLSAMYKAGILRRRVVGLGDMHSMGFPAWIYQYLLNEVSK